MKFWFLGERFSSVIFRTFSDDIWFLGERVFCDFYYDQRNRTGPSSACDRILQRASTIFDRRHFDVNRVDDRTNFYFLDNLKIRSRHFYDHDDDPSGACHFAFLLYLWTSS